MRRRLLGNRRSGISGDEQYIEIDTDASFLIRRESDSVEQTFSYTEVINGTYDTFISGTNGGVLQWITGGLTLIPTASTLPRLFSNSGNPHIYCYTLESGLKSFLPQMDLSGDFIITSIQGIEENGNNSRMNFLIRGTGSFSLGFQQRSAGNGFVYINKFSNTGSTFSPDFSYVFPNNTRRLYTFSRINGVFQFRTNTSLLTDASPLNGGYIGGGYAQENQIVINSLTSSISATLGKMNKYEHFGILTGEKAANTDIATHINSIMTKYGL